MAYDRPFWARERWGSSFLPSGPAYHELHDYDFEVRGPYRPGALTDAYADWRRFRAEEHALWEDACRRGYDVARYAFDVDPTVELRRWRAWRRGQQHGGIEGARRALEDEFWRRYGISYGSDYFTEPRPDEARRPYWRRADL